MSKFKIVIEVEYEDLSMTPEDTEIHLYKELDRHIQDGLLLYDEQVSQYSAEVEHIAK